MFPFLSFSLCLVFDLRASYFLATSLIHLKFYIKIVFNREQDGGGVGGCGVALSSRIHQEYTFRHRNACRTPAEIRQEDLTTGNQYIELSRECMLLGSVPSQQRFGVTDIKALGASPLSGLGQTVL